MKPGCIVMAAGRGIRFGANKLLADFGGKPLFCCALDAVERDLFSRVIVVTGHEPVTQAALERGFSVVSNDCPEAGISRTIALGLEAAGSCSGALFMTADQPLLTSEILSVLTSVFADHPDQIVAAAYHGQRGNPCLFPQDLFPELMGLEGDRGGASVIRNHPDRLKLVEVPEEALFDCDTPEALAICRENYAKKVQNFAKNDLTSI